MAWSLFFIFLLYFSAPAYAAFSKLEVYTNIIGRDLTDIRPWMFTWGELGLIQICGKNAASIDAIVAACKAIAGHPGVVRLQDFVINTDVIVLSTPEIAGLPYVISGLVAAGGLAAALSTADGLLLAIANALSHDVYYKMIDPNAPTVRRLTVARVLLLVVAVCAASTASTRPGDILAMVGWAFSLAMAGNFPALVMGIWWKRATSTGAICGIIAGFGLCLFYLVTTRYFPGAGVKYFGMTSLLNPVTGAPLVDIAKAWRCRTPWRAGPTLAHPLANKVGWFNLNNIACGLLGMPLGFLVDLRRQPDGQGTVEGDAGLRRRDPQAARPDDSRREDLTEQPARSRRAGPFGAPLFSRLRVALPGQVDACHRRRSAIVAPRLAIAEALHGRFWTCSSLVALLVLSPAELRSGGADVHAARPRAARADRRPGFAELHLAILLPHHRSGRRASRVGDAEGDRAGGGLAVRRRLAVLAARRASLLLLLLVAPPARRSRAMDRNFYYIGIAFFGMINGLFNQTWLLFASDQCSPGAGAAVRQRVADAAVRVADGIDRDHHSRRHSGGALRARHRRQGRFDRTSRCGSGLPATALLDAAGDRQFLEIGL